MKIYKENIIALVREAGDACDYYIDRYKPGFYQLFGDLGRRTFTINSTLKLFGIETFAVHSLEHIKEYKKIFDDYLADPTNEETEKTFHDVYGGKGLFTCVFQTDDPDIRREITVKGHMTVLKDEDLIALDEKVKNGEDCRLPYIINSDLCIEGKPIEIKPHTLTFKDTEL